MTGLIRDLTLEQLFDEAKAIGDVAHELHQRIALLWSVSPKLGNMALEHLESFVERQKRSR